MEVILNLPDLNLKKEEIQLLLAIKLFEDEIISIGKAAEIANYSEKSFIEILIHKDIKPIKYLELDANKEFENA